VRVGVLLVTELDANVSVRQWSAVGGEIARRRLDQDRKIVGRGFIAEADNVVVFVAPGPGQQTCQ
jgi:hypothetical protein